MAAPKLKPEHAEKILGRNLANLIRKVEEGKTLSNAEMAIVQSYLDGDGDMDAKGWASNLVELADALGVTRQTLYNWQKIRKNGPPGAESNGKYNVVEWKNWMKSTGRGGGVDGDGAEDERARLEAKGLILRNRRLELDIAEREGELISRAEVVADISQAVVAFKRELYRMAASLAPQIAGLPVAEIELRLRDAVDEALMQIHAGKWEQ